MLCKTGFKIEPCWTPKKKNILPEILSCTDFGFHFINFQVINRKLQIR